MAQSVILVKTMEGEKDNGVVHETGSQTAMQNNVMDKINENTLTPIRITPTRIKIWDKLSTARKVRTKLEGKKKGSTKLEGGRIPTPRAGNQLVVKENMQNEWESKVEGDSEVENQLDMNENVVGKIMGECNMNDTIEQIEQRMARSIVTTERNGRTRTYALNDKKNIRKKIKDLSRATDISVKDKDDQSIITFNTATYEFTNNYLEKWLEEQGVEIENTVISHEKQGICIEKQIYCKYTSSKDKHERQGITITFYHTTSTIHIQCFSSERRYLKSAKQSAGCALSHTHIYNLL